MQRSWPYVVTVVAAGWHAPRVIQSAISTTTSKIQGWPYSKVDKVLILEETVTNRDRPMLLSLIIPMILIFLAGYYRQMLARGRVFLQPFLKIRNSILVEDVLVAKLRHAMRPVFGSKNNHT